MSQQIFSDINPEVTTGLMLAALLDDFKDSLMTGLSGTSRPAALLPGGYWVDTSNEGSPKYKWSLKLYNGAIDLTILELDVITGSSGFNNADNSFTVRRISDDASGAILNLMKSRVANSGQVKNDDIVGKITFKGRTDTSNDPVVAYIQATSAEDMVSASRGVTLSLYSTPVGSNTTTEHLSLLNGLVETVLPHKFHALEFGQDAIAGTASMVVNSDKAVTEITGTTDVVVHGMEALAGDSKVKIIINATDKRMTFKDQSATADPEERIDAGFDIVVPPQGSAYFIYSSADSRWKCLSSTAIGFEQSVTDFTSSGTWTAPKTGIVTVSAVPSAEVPARNFRFNVTAGVGYAVSLISGVGRFNDNYVGSSLGKITVYIGE